LQKKGREEMKNITDLLFYPAALVPAYWLKSFFSQAEVGDLIWVLKPVAILVSHSTGIGFTQDSTVGFVNQDHSLIIAPACAGVNFMVIGLLMISCLGISRLEMIREKIYCLLISPVIVYVAGILVNSLRITISIWLFEADIYTGFFTEELVHRLVGVIVYLSGLWILNCIAEYIMRYLQSQTSGQVFSIDGRWYLRVTAWYLLIVIVIPLFHSTDGRLPPQFIVHCLSVGLGCVCLIFMRFLVKLFGFGWKIERHAQRGRYDANDPDRGR
jgi:exosortase K